MPDTGKPVAAMTQPERAVAVARDILANLPLYKFATSNYLRVTSQEAIIRACGGAVWADADATPFVPAIRDNCEVCMLGAAMLSAIGLFDKFKLRDLVGSNGYSAVDGGTAETYLTQNNVFSPRTTGLLECAFEMSPAFRNHETTYHEANGAVVFGYGFASRAEAVAAAMENVIANNGEFVVPAASNYEVAAAYAAYADRRRAKTAKETA